MLIVLVLGGACLAGVHRVGWPTVQRLLRTRLAPIAWAHLGVAVVALCTLWMQGARVFRDYEHPAQTTPVASTPDIYLITIDALRAQDTSVYGYAKETTPNLQKFAERSFTFDYNYANSNFTTPSTASIETGKLPWSHRVFHLGGFLRGPNQQQNLTTALKGQGYYTAMISSNLVASPFHLRTLASYDAVQYAFPTGLTGIQYRDSNLIGFNTQSTFAFSLLRMLTALEAYLDHRIWRDRYPSPAEDVFERAKALLERHPQSQPIFLWTHVFPPHEPYWPPPAYRHRFVPGQVRHYDKFEVLDEYLRPGVSVKDLRAAYDEMILYADHSVGDFLDWLDRTGRLDRSIVIVTSDHGELFDHNRLTHGGPDLYDGVIHIPLLIHLPGQKNGARVEESSQQVDLLPTVLDLIGAPVPRWTEGSSLKPALDAKTMPDRFLFSMSLVRDRIFDPISKGTVAVMDNDFKFVRYLGSGAEQLYRYKTDVGEEHNLIQSEPEVAERMRDVLLKQIQEVNRQPIGIP